VYHHQSKLISPILSISRINFDNLAVKCVRKTTSGAVERTKFRKTSLKGSSMSFLKHIFGT
jgi:hypothetical protein